MKRKDNPQSLEREALTAFQRWYWKNPGKARALQRAKYRRYPEKIAARNKAWQEKNKKHWLTLVRYGMAIRAARMKGDLEKASLLCAAREAYKKLRKRRKNYAVS